MFINKPVTTTSLDEAIEEALRELKGHDAHTESYAQVVDQITKLHAIKDNNKPDRVSKDTLALVLGNITGIVMIVGYERTHIVTSKAMLLFGKHK